MNCLCNLFDDSTIWVIILALIILYCCCGNHNCNNNCGNPGCGGAYGGNTGCGC